MSIEFSCPHCGKHLRTPDETAGRQAKCPQCGELSQIPIAALAPAPTVGDAFHGTAGPSGESFEFNPYQSPTTISASPATQTRFDPRDLASLGARLGGAILDNLIFVAAATPGFILLIQSEANGRAGAGQDEEAMFLEPTAGAMLFWAGLLAVGIVNWILIAQSGQSLAKKMIGTRIIRLDGSLPGFGYGVVMRSWLPQVIGAIPIVGGLFGLADTLAIFGSERRCIHDHIAGTRVVRA